MYNILVIDDEPLNIKLIAAYLEDYPYTIVTANGATDAWELLQGDNHFDLILLDRMMPDVDGLELAKNIREDAKLKSIPIIMQTAAAEKSQIDEGLQSGILHYITKPYDEEALNALIRTILR